MLVICLFIALLLPLSVLAQFDLNFDHEIDEPIFNSNPILNDLLRETELEISLFDKRDDSALLAQAAGTAVSGTSQPLPSSSAGSGSSQAQLNEFTPISNEIKQSETQFYSFGVNTSSGIGEYYEFLIFLTGNICLQPSVLPNNASLTVYYSFNSTMFQNMEIAEMVHFENGYFQALTDVPINLNAVNSDSILYIAVRAPENTNQSVTWSYEIGVSQNDLVFQWDDRAWASVVDTDENSALIVTGNLTSRDSLIGSNLTLVNATQVSKYELFIYLYDYKDYFNQLNSSWCAIRNGPSLFPGKLFESLFTNRSGFLQQQFYVDSLNSSTTYIAYLVSDFGGSNFGEQCINPSNSPHSLMMRVN